MKIVSFSPFEQMDSLRNQIDRVFADLEETVANDYAAWKPAIELLDDNDNLILRIFLAGINRQSLDIEATRKSVTITGERLPVEAESANYLYSELSYGKFRRQVSLPLPILNSQVKADYEDGILTLILPKVEEAKQKVVKISLNANSPTASLPETEAKPELTSA